MPHPKSPHAYEDIRRAFDLALEHGGARRVCANREDAIKWRHRAHRFRATLRGTTVEGLIPPTPYDTLTLTIPVDEPHVVQLSVVADAGQMETLDGRPLDGAIERADDALAEDARALAKEMGIEL